MTTILIITVAIATLILIGKLANRKSGKSISNSSAIEKYGSIDNLLKRANEKQLLKDYKSAVAIADKILIIEPDNYKALTCRASSLEALNFNLEAIDDYEKALQIDNSDANIYGLLGLTYIKIGDNESAQKNLKISIQKGLKFYEIFYDMLLSDSGRTKQAIVNSAKVRGNLQKRNPNDFIDDLSPVDKNEFKEALKNQIHQLEGAISLDPDNTELKELYEFAKRQLD
ncbi:MAG: tetratricopeptide repeat protein [Saprospiraceae bacterium]|nr:tetratricopeptide repeat protein [Saprospiraceae bacterium]